MIRWIYRLAQADFEVVHTARGGDHRIDLRFVDPAHRERWTLIGTGTGQSLDEAEDELLECVRDQRILDKELWEPPWARRLVAECERAVALAAEPGPAESAVEAAS